MAQSSGPISTGQAGRSYAPGSAVATAPGEETTREGNCDQQHQCGRGRRLLAGRGVHSLGVDRLRVGDGEVAAILIAPIADPGGVGRPVVTGVGGDGRELRPERAHHEVVVIDETSLFTEDGTDVFGWAALDGKTKQVIMTWVTQGRGGLEALLFLKNVLRQCSNRPFIQVDRGVWYPWACRTLGLRWKVQRGGMRNHVENWFGSLKWRLGATRRRPGTWHTQTSLHDFMGTYATFWNEGLL